MATATPPLRNRCCDLCGISLQITGSCVLVPIATRWQAPGLLVHRVTETWCGGCANATHAKQPYPRSSSPRERPN